MKQKLLYSLILLWGTMFSTNASAQKQVYTTGNNAHKVEHEQQIQLCTYESESKPFVVQNYDGYTVVKGWFGDDVTKLSGGPTYTFNGPTGYYCFVARTDRGENYIEVIPMGGFDVDNIYMDPQSEGYYSGKPNSGFHTQDASKYSWYNYSEGSGTIWVSGGQNFAFPLGSWKHDGWVTDVANRFYDNTTAMFKKAKENYYTIDITTGKEMASGSEFLFKFYHTPACEVWIDNAWRKYYEFRKNEKNDALASGGKKSTIDFDQTYLGNGAYTMDYLMITTDNNSNPSYNEGNITVKKLTDYYADCSALSYGQLPDGYTFNFIIDLTQGLNDASTRHDPENRAFSYTHAPLGVNLIARPSYLPTGYYYNNGAEQNFHSTSFVNGMANEGKESSSTGVHVKVMLNNQTGLNGSKRIALRDALRFDWCILYANQLSDKVFYDKLTIEGNLDANDMKFLGALVKGNHVEYLDLTQAKIPGNRIPDEWAKGNTKLDHIQFPAALEEIGKSAFEDSDRLTTVDFSHGTNCQLQERAFYSCNALGNITFDLNGSDDQTKFYLMGESIFEDCGAMPGDLWIEDGSDRLLVDRILQHVAGDGVVKKRTFARCSISKVTIPENITALDAEAFANCSNLHIVTVPNKVKSLGGEVTSATETTVDNNTYGDPYKTISIPSGIVDARDFNKGENKGYYFAGTGTDGKNITWNDRATPDYRDEANGKVWIEASGCIGWIRGNDWFNYTFYCEQSGVYKVTTTYSGEKSGTFNLSFDGGTAITSNVTTVNSDAKWNKRTTDANNTVTLKKGWHVMKASNMGTMNLYQFQFTLQSEVEDDKTAITPVEGNYAKCNAANVFDKVYSNQCEVRFTGGDDVNQYQLYRGDEGWMYLLTKSIYELYDTKDTRFDGVNGSTVDISAQKNEYRQVHFGDTKQHDYDVCNQKHADVRLFREMGAYWDSMILPFDIYAGTDKENKLESTIRTKEGYISHAAILITGEKSKKHLDYLNVGGHNTDTNAGEYGKAGNTESDGYKLSAGTPFLVKVTTAFSEYCTFTNVETFEKPTSEQTETGGDYQMTGTYNAIQTAMDVEDRGGVWAMKEGKLVHALKTAKFKGYRCWIQLNNGTAAKEMTTLTFDTTDDTTTGISHVTADDKENASNAFYTLSGIRTTHPQKGVYIVNGKKVIIK